jgi:hypothetical protein
MFTQIKYPELCFIKNTRLLTLLVIITFWIIPVKAQIGGGFSTEIQTYDFTDFKPLSPEKFVETNFDKLKREYDKFPSTLVNGYRIEIIPNKRQGFRPSVSTHLIYNSLIDNAILDWAHQNKYAVLLNNGYQIVKNQDDGTKITINVTTSAWWPNPKKTIEQDFLDRHSLIYTNSTGSFNVANTRLSTLHGIKIYEKEAKIITERNLRDAYTKKVNQLIQSGGASKEKDIELLNTYANSYTGSIVLMRTKYGELSGEITKAQETQGINTNLEPLKEMILSMLNFCDDKTNSARLLFLEKSGNN